MKTLHVSKGYTMDTETGYQEIVSRHGDTSFVVHNFDFDGKCTGASMLTDIDIKCKAHDMTGKAYDSVCFDD